VTRWQGLGAIMPRLRRALDTLPAGLALREQAAHVALTTFGAETVSETQGLVNAGALAVLTRCQPPTWLCRPSASAVVHGTDLHSIPTEPPTILRGPGLVEVRRPETGERLWGDVASLGWYAINETYFLMGLTYPDGFVLARWTPRWSGGELEAELPSADHSPLIDDVDAHHEFARQAARYLIVLGLLAEAETSPLRIEIDRRDRRTKHIYFDDAIRPPRAVDPVEDAVDGRIADAVIVSGHLKRQRHGEGRAQVKWIYVAGYSARRWFAPRWRVERREEPS
jgi:hypothetical protein